MEKKIFFIWLLSAALLISLILNVVFVFNLVKFVDFQKKEVEKQKFYTFKDLFIEKILLAESVVDFETRLSLETAVRALGDKEVFVKWQVFSNCKTKEDATKEAKDLLKILIKKTSAN